MVSANSASRAAENSVLLMLSLSQLGARRSWVARVTPDTARLALKVSPCSPQSEERLTVTLQMVAFCLSL